ncbi:MAG: LysM peptidoglycan-binding domain-containing protein [Phycisphaerae bacterium]
MAQETKVGLLAGLAFIICFAVVLTNRGREYVSPPMPNPTYDRNGQPWIDRTRTNNTPQQGRDFPASANRAGTIHVNSNHGHPRHNGYAGESHPAPWGRQTGSQPIPTYATHVPDHARQQNHARQQGDALEQFESANPVSRPTNETYRALEERLAGNRQEWNGQSDQFGQDAQPMSRDGAFPNQELHKRTLIAEPSSSRHMSSTPMATYTVQKGDTLTRIAKNHYGRSDRDILNAIQDANRATMPDLNHIRPGMDLLMPPVGQPSRSVENRGSIPTTNQDARRRQGQPATRTYLVRANDSYIKIARRELGDERLWLHIADLNRDIFPDAQQIRSGVEIRLPSRSN